MLSQGKPADSALFEMRSLVNLMDCESIISPLDSTGTTAQYWLIAFIALALISVISEPSIKCKTKCIFLSPLALLWTRLLESSLKILFSRHANCSSNRFSMWEIILAVQNSQDSFEFGLYPGVSTTVSFSLIPFWAFRAVYSWKPSPRSFSLILSMLLYF